MTRFRLRGRRASQRAAYGPLRSTLSIPDLLREAAAGMMQRPTRAALTMLGTVLGIAAFVAVLGLTASASGQVSERFTSLAATEVRIEDSHAGNEIDRPAFPPDADVRLHQLHGVTTGGVIRVFRDTPITAHAQRPGAPLANPMPLLAVSPGALLAMRPHVASGRLYDTLAERRHLRVAVLGSSLAAQLGLGALDGQPTTILINGQRLTVMGIIDDVKRRPEALLAVLVPTATAQALWGAPTNADDVSMLVETDLGAAPLVARQAALALRPDAPDRLKVIPPPDPHQLQNQVANDLGALFAGLAGVSLLVGTIGIANTILVSVMERVPEIGLRRALGARSSHIGAQFLAEGAGLGTLGGLIGAAVGTCTVLGVCLAQHWTPLMQPWTIFTAPLLGTATGLLASAYPAVRAARIRPVQALQR